MTTDTQALATTLRRLDQLTNWEQRPRGGMRVDLAPMRDLMQRLGNPYIFFQSIHVAGTKGKGSTCSLIEVALLRAGLRVGRYSSPHVENVNERVSLHGQPASDRDLAQSLSCAIDSYEAAKMAGSPGAVATWFDVFTAAAFVLFKEAGLEWAVIEVGIGGRLDSTNVIEGRVAIITNVELEHVDILGGTREAIAREKVGILKAGATLATTLGLGDPAGLAVQERADHLGCAVLRTIPSTEPTIAQRNAELAGMVLDHLGALGVVCRSHETTTGVGAWLLDERTRIKAQLPGRLERRQVSALDRQSNRLVSIPIVLDGAHVPFSLEAVLKDLASEPDLGGPCVAIVAIATDKDISGLMTALARRAFAVIGTELTISSRGASLEEVQAQSVAHGMKCETEPNRERALERAAQLALASNAWLLVTGSLTLVGALRPLTVNVSLPADRSRFGSAVE